MKLSTVLAMTVAAATAPAAIADNLVPDRYSAFEQPVRNTGIRPFGATPSAAFSARTAFPRLVPDDGREYTVVIEEDFSLMTAGSEIDPDPNTIEGDYFMIPSQYTHTPGWCGRGVKIVVR